MVARGGPALVDSLVSEIRAVFTAPAAAVANVYLIKPTEENVNVTLVAVKQPGNLSTVPQPPSAASASSAAASASSSKAGKSKGGAGSGAGTTSGAHKGSEEARLALKRQSCLEDWLQVRKSAVAITLNGIFLRVISLFSCRYLASISLTVCLI